MSKTSKQFDTPDKVTLICEAMQDIETKRAGDRALINNQFNGGRPYTPDEAEKFQIHINVNWQEGGKILQDATGQINNALIYKERLFTATSKGGKVEKRDEYSEVLTKHINEALKTGPVGRRHMFLLRSRNAALSLHGIGPIMWLNSYNWLGRFIPLEDLLIPTDTLVDFSNLNHFAVNLYLTQAEFFDMTHGEKVDKGWSIKAVRQILDDLADTTAGKVSNFTFRDQPEKRVEQFKQNHCYYDSDAVSTVKLRMFFYRDKSTEKWHRCAVLREATANQPVNKNFIYDGRDVEFADGIERMMHVLFGDNNLCAPLKYHSVRGLGVMLYGPVECNNRVRCEAVQHLMLNLKTFLRISNPTDRDRPKLLDLSQYSVIQDGVTMIPNTERHQVDARLVEYIQSQMRQLMSENSASFVQDINDGTSKEMTATETNARVQSVNVQVSTMLQSIYAQEVFYYEEVLRRFLNPNSGNDEVEKFREKCISDGIPEKLMVSGNWAITIERVLGAGDQFIAGQEANSLLSQSQRFDPNAQRTILRKWVVTTTRNPSLGELLVPQQPVQATPGVIAAEDVFGTLMAGIPASIREGIDRASYVQSLVSMIEAKVQQIEQIDGMGTPQEFIGLQTAIDHAGKNIQILEADATQKQAVKMFSDQLGKVSNMVKAFGQRQEEAAQNDEANIDQEAMAKARSTMMLAETKVKISEMSSGQKMQHKQQQFEQQMSQMMEKHKVEMAKMLAETNADLMAGAAKTQADIENSKAKAKATAAAKPSDGGE